MVSSGAAQMIVHVARKVSGLRYIELEVDIFSVSLLLLQLISKQACVTISGNGH